MYELMLFERSLFSPFLYRSSQKTFFFVSIVKLSVGVKKVTKKFFWLAIFFDRWQYRTRDPLKL